MCKASYKNNLILDKGEKGGEGMYHTLGQECMHFPLPALGTPLLAKRLSRSFDSTTYLFSIRYHHREVVMVQLAMWNETPWEAFFDRTRQVKSIPYTP